MEQIKIDLLPSGVMANAHASQYDIGRTIKFYLTDEGVAYTLAGTEVITLTLRKPDGSDDTISLTNTSSNYVEWTTNDGDLNLSGAYLVEITITSGSDVLGTANFLLKVEPDAYDGKSIRVLSIGPLPICTFDTTLAEPYQSVTVNVLATGGNGSPDNPISINGYSSANITRCGVNLWDESIKRGYIYNGNYYSSDSYWCNDGNIPVKPNTTYTFSGITSGGQICFYDINNTYMNDNTGTANKTFTTPSGCYYISVYNPVATESNDKQLELGSSPSTYHPYNGNTYTIAFGQTVYGGVLDVTSGKLTVTHRYFTDNGDGAWVRNDDGSFYVWDNDFGDAVQTNDGLSNYGTYAVDFSGTNIFIRPTQKIASLGRGFGSYFASADDLKAEFAITPIQIVYPLATPFDIDLTPVQISAIVGENNVYADCGETEVEFLAEV